MALYREYCGAALPLEGGVQTQYFLNAGLAQRTADAMLSMLPGMATLKQGKLRSGENSSPTGSIMMLEASWQP
jgi:hypothetical protein